MTNPKMLCLIAAVLVCGCSRSGLELAPLSGTVTHQGQKLTHGQVVLVPTSGTKGPPGIGNIKEDGTYSIETQQCPGAVVGKHKVVVVCRQKATEQEKLDLTITSMLIPMQYTNDMTTPLEVTIPAENRTFNIDLK